MRKVHTKSKLSDSIFSLSHKGRPSPHEERRGDRFKSSGPALDPLRMPLPFGTPRYFGDVGLEPHLLSVSSSGWQESPRENTQPQKKGMGGEGVDDEKEPGAFLYPPG